MKMHRVSKALSKSWLGISALFNFLTVWFKRFMSANRAFDGQDENETVSVSLALGY